MVDYSTFVLRNNMIVNLFCLFHNKIMMNQSNELFISFF